MGVGSNKISVDGAEVRAQGGELLVCLLGGDIGGKVVMRLGRAGIGMRSGGRGIAALRGLVLRDAGKSESYGVSVGLRGRVRERRRRWSGEESVGGFLEGVPEGGAGHGEGRARVGMRERWW